MDVFYSSTPIFLQDEYNKPEYCIPGELKVLSGNTVSFPNSTI